MMHLNVPIARMLGLPRLPAFMNVVLQPLANLLRVERASNGDVAYSLPCNSSDASWKRIGKRRAIMATAMSHILNGDFADHACPLFLFSLSLSLSLSVRTCMYACGKERMPSLL